MESTNAKPEELLPKHLRIPVKSRSKACPQVMRRTTAKQNYSRRKSVGISKMNHHSGDTALLDRPPKSRSEASIMNPVGEQEKRANTGPKQQQGGRPTSQNRGATNGQPNRATNGQRPSTRRPSAKQLSALVQDYATSIKECEAVRNEADAKATNAEQRKRTQAKIRADRWNHRESFFATNITKANLGPIWEKYVQQYPTADHTHQLSFFGWATITGTYPHGKIALQEDWNNALSDQPVLQRVVHNSSPPPGSSSNRRRHGYRRNNGYQNRPTNGPQPDASSKQSPDGKSQSNNANQTNSTTNPSAAPGANASYSTTSQTNATASDKAPTNVKNWTVIGIVTGAAVIAGIALMIAT